MYSLKASLNIAGRLINTDINVKVSYTIKFFSKIMTVSSTRGQSDINSADREPCKNEEREKKPNKNRSPRTKNVYHVKESVYCISMSQLL